MLSNLILYTELGETNKIVLYHRFNDIGVSPYWAEGLQPPKNSEPSENSALFPEK